MSRKDMSCLGNQGKGGWYFGGPTEHMQGHQTLCLGRHVLHNVTLG